MRRLPSMGNLVLQRCCKRERHMVTQNGEIRPNARGRRRKKRPSGTRELLRLSQPMRARCVTLRGSSCRFRRDRLRSRNKAALHKWCCRADEAEVSAGKEGKKL